jgi:anti-sigma28 factor (negative regulator of flagellin synthesis)
MAIDGIGYGAIGPRGTQGPGDVDPPGGKDPSGAERTTRVRTDSVEISREGRELAETGLTAERIEELRGKIADKTYDRTNVAEDVARRILASGDVT